MLRRFRSPLQLAEQLRRPSKLPSLLQAHPILPAVPDLFSCFRHLRPLPELLSQSSLYRVLPLGSYLKLLI